MFKVQNKDINIHPYGSSHPKMFREKCVLKNFIKVQSKTPAMASLFQWTYLQAVILQYNKGAMADVFLWILQNISELFYRMPVIASVTASVLIVIPILNIWI